jgi:hypothetical protein
MINTETSEMLEQKTRNEYIGSYPVNTIPEADILENLKMNMDHLEELCVKLNFVMREIRTVMKV